MQRRGYLGLAIAVLLTLAGPVQAATPKAGAKCTKAGTTATASGKKFTCIKSGTKLVWNKGVAIKKPSPVATPTPTPEPIATPTPTPTPTSTPTPTPTPTPTLKDLTFSNIVENVDAISFNIYSKYQAHMATSYQGSIKVNTLVGPNTVPVNKNSAAAYQVASKIFQNFKQPDEVFGVYYNFADKEWAKNEVAIRAGKDTANFQFGYSCPNASRCWDASASITLDWKAIAHFGASDPGGSIDTSELTGEIQIHEFTHSISFYQLKPIRGNYYNLTPDWFAEGHASFAGKLGASPSFEEYKMTRIRAQRNPRPQADIKNYQPENILRFYAEFSKYPEVSKIERFYLYSLGWSTIEALAAIGGIDSPMNLFVETSKGLTFKQAFKKIYGIEWDAAAPILAEVVSKQFRVYHP
jgi:hypothetical protein